MKLGLLYSSPTFTEYASLKKTTTGAVDPNASIDDYKTYADKTPTNPPHLADKAVIASIGSLRTLNFQQVLAGYSDLGLAEKFKQANPTLINNLINPATPANTTAPIGSPPGNAQAPAT